ncbi:MAG: hypothetical protein AAGA92_11005 [Planctomycetota bacterium]
MANPSESRTATTPAWLTSVTLHAAAVALLLLVPAAKPRGAATEPTRQVGIVLKPADDSADRYIGEAESQQPSEPVVETPRLDQSLPTLDDLPTLASVDLPSAGASPKLSGSNGTPAGGARASGGRPSFLGNKARVSVFGVEGVGTRFVYVFDRSVSMEGRPLAAAKRQLLGSLDALDSVHQFQVIFFNHQPKAWDLTGGQNRIAFATDRNKRLAARFVRGVSASGGTYRRLALANGLALGPDVVFFLTDVDDPMSDADVASAIRQANNSGTSINTIEFGLARKPLGRNFLATLAEGTGGRYGYVSLSDLGSDRPAQELPQR